MFQTSKIKVISLAPLKLSSYLISPFFQAFFIYQVLFFFKSVILYPMAREQKKVGFHEPEQNQELQNSGTGTENKNKTSNIMPKVSGQTRNFLVFLILCKMQGSLTIRFSKSVQGRKEGTQLYVNRLYSIYNTLYEKTF